MGTNNKPLGGLGLAIYEFTDALRALWLQMLDVYAPYALRMARWLRLLE